MNIIKNLVFTSHYSLVIYTLYPYSKYNTIIAFIVYISWLLNNNYCLISQMEYKYFGETFVSKRLRKVRPIDKATLLSSQLLKYIFLPENLDININNINDIYE